MTINERFEAVIQVLFGGNKRAFALHVGISPTVVENVVGTRKGKPSFDVLEKVCANANISAEWLLLGKGEMLMDMFEIRKPMIFHSDDTLYENKTQEDAEDKPIARLATSPGEGIPLLPIDAWAGLFKGEQTVTLAECDHFIVPAFKNADFLIPVRGDSMVPRYYSGDLVACKHLPLSDIFFQWGKVYVLDTNQGALIKEVRQGSSAHTIKLVSENPKYEPFEIPRECIYNIAIVQGLIRSE